MVPYDGPKTATIRPRKMVPPLSDEHHRKLSVVKVYKTTGPMSRKSVVKKGKIFLELAETKGRGKNDAPHPELNIGTRTRRPYTGNVRDASCGSRGTKAVGSPGLLGRG